MIYLRMSLFAASSNVGRTEEGDDHDLQTTPGVGPYYISPSA